MDGSHSRDEADQHSARRDQEAGHRRTTEEGAARGGTLVPAPQKPKETTKEQAPGKQAAPAPQPQLPPEAQAAIKGVVPVFKVQVFAINRQLHHDSEQFKGHKEVDSFVEDGLYKYTIGASTNYNDIIKLKKKLAADFPNCFIIAFDGDKRMNTSLAIAAFLQNAKKK